MKKIAYVGCLGLIGIITTEFGVIGILPQIAEHYQISIDKAGILLSAFALVIAVTGPFMTLFTSGFDRKKIMMLSIAIFLLTGTVSALAPPFWLLVLVRMLPAFAYMTSAAPHATEFANSLAISFGNLGVTAGTVVSGWFIASGGIIQSPWVGMGFGILAIGMICWRSVLDAKPDLSCSAESCS